MKSFFKYTLATIVGFLISLFILFFVFLGILGTMIANTDKPTQVKPNSVLHLHLNQEIRDRGSDNPMNNFDITTLKLVKKPGLNDILNNIEKAKDDENIKGIFLDLRFIQGGFATVKEIRDALLDFKESGKFIISYSDIYSQKAYYLASVSDSIFLNPMGMIDFSGLTKQVIFYKGAFDKLGIEPEIIRHGEYKSYVEPYMLKKMSEENRKQTIAYLADVWNYMVKEIAIARQIEVETLNKAADDLTAVFDPEQCANLNFVDGLKYRDEMISSLKIITGVKSDKKVSLISLEQYNTVPKKRVEKSLIKDKIAVVYTEGDITFGEGDENSVGADRFSEAIRNARTDTTIKAIVVRVNSPGGSMLASEIIRREIYLASTQKPVVASMGSVAASGGYYIICNADTILASPNSITGSIGVFALLFNAKQFLNDKIGITSDVVKTNDKSDLGTFLRPLTESEKALLLKYVKSSYDDFIGLVADGRDMKTEEVDKIGRGLVYSGEDALNIGLIDKFGGLKKAIEVAAEMAKIETYRIVNLPKEDDPFESILKGLTSEVKNHYLKSEFGNDYRYYSEFKNLLRFQGIQARLPFELVEESLILTNTNGW